MRFPIAITSPNGRSNFSRARHSGRQEEAREAFQASLRDYAAAIGSDSEPYLLELVIRRARRLTHDEAPLSGGDLAALAQLSDRYWAFRPEGAWHNIISFSDARRMLHDLFF